jgi:hypothetical protein
MARARHGSRQPSSARSSRGRGGKRHSHPMTQVRQAGSSGNASTLCREKMSVLAASRGHAGTICGHVCPNSLSELEALRHKSDAGNNMPKDVGEVETPAQALWQGGWLPPGRKVGWGGELRWHTRRTSAQRENRPSHRPPNRPACHSGQHADPCMLLMDSADSPKPRPAVSTGPRASSRGKCRMLPPAIDLAKCAPPPLCLPQHSLRASAYEIAWGAPRGEANPPASS